MIDLIVASTATFGVSSLVSGYGGPFDVFVRLRKLSHAFSCTVCLSVWVSVPMLLLTYYGGMFIVSALSIIGVVIILERIT